jgi:glycerate kinase
MQILISPNAFKNSLDASAVAEAIEKGLQQSSLICTTTCFPIGDGGDGTGRLLTQLCGGVFINETVQGPLGRKVEAGFGLIDNGQTAVIEMADASGLRLLSDGERNPLQASSFGTGELLVKALDQNVKKIILCIGGSATVDGGCGILQALGTRFLDDSGQAFNNLPESLINLAEIDLSGLDKRVKNCEFIILCDVTNTLLGENGSAKIFGPQKGASEKMVEQLEAALTQFNKIVLQQTGIDLSVIKHGGAAGGVAAGLNALIDAKLVNGIDEFLAITCFDMELKKANLLITGEGSIDLQTLGGKAPYGVAVRAKQKNIPVIALAGKTDASHELNKWFDEILNINNGSTDLDVAIAATAENLTQTAMDLGNRLAEKSKS